MYALLAQKFLTNPKKKHKLPKVMKNKKEKRKKKRKSTIQPFFRGETLLLSNFSGGGGVG